MYLRIQTSVEILYRTFYEEDKVHEKDTKCACYLVCIGIGVLLSLTWFAIECMFMRVWLGFDGYE